MLTSSLGVVGLAAILMLAFGVLNPVLALIVAALAILPFAFLLGASLFRKAGGTVATRGSAVPSTADASYDPVSDPSQRN